MMATAKEIADERFARGDITKSEYDDIIQTVGASGISEPDAAKSSLADDETALEAGIKLYATTAFLTLVAFLIFRAFFFEQFYSLVVPLLGKLSGESGFMVELQFWGADYSKLKPDLWFGYLIPLGILAMILHPFSKSAYGK